jgi:hypothetical protein
MFVRIISTRIIENRKKSFSLAAKAYQELITTENLCNPEDYQPKQYNKTMMNENKQIPLKENKHKSV